MRYYDIYQFSQLVNAKVEDILKMEKDGFWGCAKTDEKGVPLYSDTQIKEFESSKISFDSYIKYLNNTDEKPILKVVNQTKPPINLDKAPDLSDDEIDFSKFNFIDDENEIDVERVLNNINTQEESDNANTQEESALNEREMADENLRERQEAEAQAYADQLEAEEKKKKIQEQKKRKRRENEERLRRENQAREAELNKQTQQSIENENGDKYDQTTASESKYDSGFDEASQKYETDHYSSEKERIYEQSQITPHEKPSYKAVDEANTAMDQNVSSHSADEQKYKENNNNKPDTNKINTSEKTYSSDTKEGSGSYYKLHKYEHDPNLPEKTTLVGSGCFIKETKTQETSTFNMPRIDLEAHVASQCVAPIKTESHYNNKEEYPVPLTPEVKRAVFSQNGYSEEMKVVKNTEVSQRGCECIKNYATQAREDASKSPENASQNTPIKPFQPQNTTVFPKEVNPSTKTEDEHQQKHSYGSPQNAATGTDHAGAYNEKYEQKETVNPEESTEYNGQTDRNTQQLILNKYGKVHFGTIIENGVYAAVMTCVSPTINALKNNDAYAGMQTTKSVFTPFLRSAENIGFYSRYVSERDRFQKKELKEFNKILKKNGIIERERRVTLNKKADVKNLLNAADAYFRKRGVLSVPITSLSRHEIRTILKDNGKRYKMFTEDDKAVLRMLCDKRGHGLLAMRDACNSKHSKIKNIRDGSNQIINKFFSNNDFVRGVRFCQRTVRQIYNITKATIKTIYHIGKGAAYGIRAIRRAQKAILTKQIKKLDKKVDVKWTQKKERLQKRLDQMDARNNRRKSKQDARRSKKDEKNRRRRERRERKSAFLDRVVPHRRFLKWFRNTKFGKIVGKIGRILTAPFDLTNILKAKLRAFIIKIVVIVGGIILLINFMTIPLQAAAALFENMFGFFTGDGETDNKDSAYVKAAKELQKKDDKWYKEMEKKVSKMKPSDPEIDAFEEIVYKFEDGNGNEIEKYASNIKELMCMGHVYMQYDITGENEDKYIDYVSELFNKTRTYETQEVITYCKGCKILTNDGEDNPDDNPDDPNADNSEEVSYYCPGHASLIVTVKIFTLTGENNVYTCDDVGSVPNEDTKWDGWTPENRDDVKHFYDLDWKELYEIDI